MRTSILLSVFYLTFVLGELSTAEQIVSPRTVSVALFKNGFAVVQQEFDAPAAGIYRWDEVPSVIHGTFFIESEQEVEIQTATRLVKQPIDEKNPVRSLADAAGKKVTVFLNDTDPQQRQFAGKLVVSTPSDNSNSLLPELMNGRAMNPTYFSGYAVNSPSVTNPLPATPIILEELEGANKHYQFFTGLEVLKIRTDEPLNERTVKRPVMLFNVSEKNGKTAGKIRLFYLTKGITWAPSYRISLLDKKKLQIEQSAVVRNEWMPFTDTEISLISGFPQIECSQILSPLNSTQTLERFFMQMSSQQARSRDSFANSGFISNSMMVQQAVHPGATLHSGFDTTGLAAGEGPDIHYNSIGKRTLDAGDTLSLTTGKGETEYRRVLETSIPPLYLQRLLDLSERKKDETAEVFDILKLKNPLTFPMTTAPVTVTENNKFLGQSQTNWVNPGQVASVKITKVMNVRVDCRNEIIPAIPREEQVFPNNRPYVKYSFEQKAEITNQRNEEVTLHLNSRFVSIDEELKIDPKPATRMPSDTVVYPNKAADLFWELQLKPGEKKIVTVSGKQWVGR